MNAEVVCPSGQECDPGSGECVSSVACPYWTLEELATLRHPDFSDENDGSQCSSMSVHEKWESIAATTPDGNRAYHDIVQVATNFSAGPGCQFFSFENGFNRFVVPISDEEAAVCAAEVISSGQERGYTCWD
jgi:hypothetical protein